MKTQESLEDALGNVRSNISEALVQHDDETRVNLISDNNAPPDQSLIYEMQGRSRDTYQKDRIASGKRLSFKVGIYNREEYLYYNENISREYIYVSREEFLHSFLLFHCYSLLVFWLDIRRSRNNSASIRRIESLPTLHVNLLFELK